MTDPADPREPTGPQLGRRSFLAGAIAIVTTAAGCSVGDGGGTASGSADGAATSSGATGPVATAALPGSLHADAVPTAEQMHGWIEQIVERGVRRPGYEADRWTEEFIATRLRELGLDQVRLEPVPVTRWEPRSWTLTVTPSAGEPLTIECFPAPYTAPAAGLVLDLVAFDPARPEGVAGRAALVDAPVVRIPPTALVAAGSAPEERSRRVYDPRATFEGQTHVLPHTADRNKVLDPIIAAGALAFVGVLTNHPGDGCRYYVPYDGKQRPIPAVWVRGSDGTRLHQLPGAGPVRIRLDIDSTAGPADSYNVVGELPGAGPGTVMIGSHHDGPWASAVEDASGVAMVLAQAAFWSAQPAEARPHRLVFVLHAGHMCGGAGLDAYVAAHEDELDDVVLEVHLEHAALEVTDDPAATVTGECTPRWFFTSRIPRLESTVFDAISTEGLERSMLLAPDALGQHPPTDGGAYHAAGIPIVQCLAAPSYLFEQSDTLDKIDTANLERLTRVVVRVIDRARDETAASMRRAT